MASNYSLLLLLLLAVGVSADPDLNGLLNSLSHGSVTSLHDTMQCMQKLLPCKAYLNVSATEPPPETCCSSLKDVVDNDFECLCRFYKDPQILPTLNITRHDALQLPKACNVRLRLSKCKDEANSPTPTPTDASSSTNQAAAAAAVLAAAEKSISGANASQDVPAATSGSDSTKRITYFGVVLVASASLLFMN
ncbi:lipid transfer-like protein VAS [Neltuma alba]|uniref:lipid transfer-like protein VAS n=1 Tax=Neltuma alba TaxID=207710 RepID=UPI0010A3FF0B|nr:lipid transfer-like protein VAS [Prosopis alba]